MSEPFIGQITLFAGNFAPRGWALCQGQILAINTNQALFSILGTTYGGNGQTTFALPDLRGRAALSSGQGPGLSSRDLGEVGGTETVTLTTNQIPQHTHPIGATQSASTGSRPADKVNAAGGAYSDTSDAAMKPTGIAGGSQPHDNMEPFLVLNYIIALEGIFPSRN